MEQQKQLQEYIYGQLQSGVNPTEIEQQLRGAGWDDANIKQAFSAVQSSIAPSQQSAQTGPAQAVSPDQQSAQNAETQTTVEANQYQQNSNTQQNQTQQDSAQAISFNPQGRKRGRIKTAWLLMKQSFKVLRNNKQLVRYPLFSSILVLLISILFIGIGFLGGDTFYREILTLSGEEIELTAAGNMLAIVYYLITTFIIFFYNTSLAAHTLDIFRGTSKDFKTYIKIAWSKKLQILLYTAITVTVGLILRALERNRLLGFIVSRILGVLWTFANLFTIPIIAETNQSAVSSIKQSSKLFISRWGENIAARIGFGGLAFLIYLIIFIPLMFVALLLSSMATGATGLIIFMLIFVISILIFAAIETTASSILSTALYYYARYEQVPATFSQDLLNSAFVPKKQKRKKK